MPARSATSPVRSSSFPRVPRVGRLLAAVKLSVGLPVGLPVGLSVGLAVGGVVLTGCAAVATYPKVEGSVAVDSPWLAPIPELMADAIVAAREEIETVAEDGTGRVAFNLPDGTSRAVWNEVVRRVDGAAPATVDDTAIAHVAQVRLRPGAAEVDVIVEPRADRPTTTPYLMTVTMERKLLSDWRTIRTRAWRLPVDVPALAWVPESTDDAPAEAMARPEAALPVAPPEEDAAAVVAEPVTAVEEDQDPPTLSGVGG